MRKQLVILTAGMLVLLSGCASGQQSTLKYIGADTAKAYALEAAGLTAEQVKFSGTDMGSENGMDYYEVEFSANGSEYEYEVDALTGVILETKINGREVAPQAAVSAPAQEKTAASAPAQEQTSAAPAASSQSAQTQPQGSRTKQETQTMITEEKARELALADAGVKESDVTFVRVHQDLDDGRQVYDVEFYTADYVEYDYELDAYTGAVLSKDLDAEFYAPPATNTQASSPAASGSGNTSVISEEEAKSIVLAQVPGASASDIWEFRLEYDDGRQEYEGTIIYNQMEYEFEVDAYSGAIRSWDVESIYD